MGRYDDLGVDYRQAQRAQCQLDIETRRELRTQRSEYIERIKEYKADRRNARSQAERNELTVTINQLQSSIDELTDAIDQLTEHINYYFA